MFRPGERVVTHTGGLATVRGPSRLGAEFLLVTRDADSGWETHHAVAYLRPLYYAQQLAPGARKDNPSYAAAIADEVRGEPNPYLEAQK